MGRARNCRPICITVGRISERSERNPTNGAQIIQAPTARDPTTGGEAKRCRVRACLCTVGLRAFGANPTYNDMLCHNQILPKSPMNPVRTQLLLIGTMAIWGLNISAIKVLTAYLDPLLVACLRMVLAACVINLTLAWSRRPVRLLDISAGQWLRFILCAVLMVYANQILFTSGMQTASATNSSLIMALSPLVASILAAIIFRESLTGLRLLGIVLGFGGVFAVVFSGSDAALGQAGWGDAQVTAAMFSFVAGGMLIQALARQFNALVISSFIYTIGAVLLCIHLMFSDVDFSLRALLMTGLWPLFLILFTGIVATAICNMLWNRAIAELGVARTSVFQYWIPVFGVGFAMLLLGEPFTAWHLLGLLGILLGTYLGTRRPSSPL